MTFIHSLSGHQADKLDAHYEFGPKSSDPSQPPLIDVIFAFSPDNGQTFPYRKTVTDTAWDPALNAPRPCGDPNTTFIGDYFGLDARSLGFKNYAVKDTFNKLA